VRFDVPERERPDELGELEEGWLDVTLGQGYVSPLKGALLELLLQRHARLFLFS
jgi:hypothetical protein